MADVKRCTKCGYYKPVAAFNRDSNKADGLYSSCKECHKKRWRDYYKRNRSYVLDGNRFYNSRHPESVRENVRRYCERNRNTINERAAEARRDRPHIHRKARQRWIERHPEKARACNAKGRAARKNAVPIWANLDALNRIYENCPKGCEVDHILPIRGKTVCGLHVPENLQYLSVSANRRKSNKVA